MLSFSVNRDNCVINHLLAWVEKGGIVGRGILLDYVSYCQKHNIPQMDAMSSDAIAVSTLDDIAKSQGVNLQPADILLIRVGFTEAYEKMTAPEQAAIAQRPQPNFLGVASNSDTLKWMWEHSFAAVASDAPSFEQAPIAGKHTALGGVWAGEAWEEEMIGGGLLHQWMLSGWGTPIGELFDLEALAKKCEELARWSFFVSSVPLKVSLALAWYHKSILAEANSP